MDLDNINDKVGNIMKNKMARQIIQDILQQHDNPAEKEHQNLQQLHWNTVKNKDLLIIQKENILVKEKKNIH